VRRLFRPSDSRLAAAAIAAALATALPLVESSSWFARFSSHVPGWLVPGLFGFAVALMLFDPAYKESRVREIVGRFTRHFEVAFVRVGYAENPRRLQINARLRFTREIKHARLRLRVLTPIKHAVAPHQHILVLADLQDVAKGQEQTFKLGQLAIMYPGWTPVYSAWGLDDGTTLPPATMIDGPSLAILELRGVLPPQCHRFYVNVPSYGGPSPMPAMNVQDEDEDVFDVERRT
jgi:hypothetical protein